MLYSANGTCKRSFFLSVWVCFFLLRPVNGADAADTDVSIPRVLDSDYRIELVARDPQIVTPVGITFDHTGRLLVIESHTHHRPEDYEGPTGDRILAFNLKDAKQSELVESVETFYSGLTHTMSLATATDGSILVATRRQVFRLRDTSGDGSADSRTPLVTLKTEGKYPHNGLSGLALGPDDWLYFGMGENLGFPFELVGSDGSSLSGHGDGGSVYRCRPDGRSLERYATGFWNPFGNCFDEHGRLFSVDNDPDASPPCRLIHVVPTADYGYQFRYGRSGRHPLQTWTGDLPGTLGAVAGTGEAPCEMIAHNGRLWVASWGDHRIETFELHPSGASFTASRYIVVQGGKDFRPVGLKLGPDGNIYFTDWVDRSYPVHGRGRIWRLRPTNKTIDRSAFPAVSKLEARSLQLQVQATPRDLEDEDPFIRQSAVAGMVAAGGFDAINWADLETARQRIGFLQAVRWKDAQKIEPFLVRALDDPASDVRLLALRVVADQRLIDFRAKVVELLGTAEDAQTLAATAATLAWLDDGENSKNTKPVRDRVVAILRDEEKSNLLRLAAMKYLPVDDEFFDVDWLSKMARGDDLRLAAEAVRIVNSKPESQDSFLLDIARDSEREANLRADAVSGISDPESYSALHELTKANHPEAIRTEAIRTLRRLSSSDAARKQDQLPAASDTDAWLDLLESKDGDPASGRRVLFRKAGTSCVRCHSYDGRGRSVGPDLTRIHTRATARFLIESILTPEREVAPQYTPISVTTNDGKTNVGIPMEGPAETGIETFVGLDGKEFEVASDTIEARQSLKTSIMPSGFESLLTVDELRDVVAFLLEDR